MNVRSRSWTFTLNYFEPIDIDEMFNIIPTTSYSIFGFEGVDSDDPRHPHIHLFLHFEHARSFKSVKSYFTNQYHVEVVKDVPAMIEYCKGYKQGKLKWIRENVWLEHGQPPLTGVNKSSQQVIDAIKEGKSLREIEELYPSYCLHHYSKLEDMYNRRKNLATGKGQLLVDPKYTPVEGDSIIYDLSDIINAPTDVVVWYTDTFQYTPMLSNYEKFGTPLRIKNGYRFVSVKPIKIIIVPRIRDAKEGS